MVIVSFHWQLPLLTGSFLLKMAMATYNGKFTFISRNSYFQLKEATYNWQLPLKIGNCHL